VIEDLFTPYHLLILLAILFFLFGAKRLPGLGKSLGTGIREFRGGIAGLSADHDDELPESSPDKPLALPAPEEPLASATADEPQAPVAADKPLAPAAPGAADAAPEGEPAATAGTAQVIAEQDTEQRAAS
jgi:sec-independent protein translocase protein TatA